MVTWLPVICQRVVRSPFLTNSLAFLALEVLGSCCSGTSPVIAGIRQGVWSWQSWKPNALNASATCVSIRRLLMSQTRTSRRGDASDDSPCGGSLVDYSVDWLFTLVSWLILTVWLLVLDWSSCQRSVALYRASGNRFFLLRTARWICPLRVQALSYSILRLQTLFFSSSSSPRRYYANSPRIW